MYNPYANVSAGAQNFDWFRFDENGQMMTKTLPEFSQSYPNVEVQVREANSVDLEREIIARRLDFALIHGFAILDRQPSDNIEYQILSRDDFCIITKRGAPIGDRKSVV